MNAVIKQLLVTVLGGVAVALLLPLVAGCSSPGGCRTCRKEPPGREPAPLGYNLPVGPAAPPGGAAAVAAPYGGQKTCPVIGEELGSMGAPVPVTFRAPA